ncbi:MAG TPA: DUF362 domain-containing protein [Candidatus Binatia bacterium]|nr:DUF362 domain-containing protein [Candidatus Binatia bacterium]
MLTRREFIKISTTAAALYPLTSGCEQLPRWEGSAYRKPQISRVAIFGTGSYDKSLSDTILRGIKLFTLDLKGKTIVLKPNLVEFDPHGVINTHPRLVAAAIEAFKRLGSKEVIVAEGPGHRRDNEYLLSASGLYDVVKEYRVRYVDLNTDDVRPTKLRSRFTTLDQLYLPETLFNADLLVSMPKLKTHHWAGVTLSLKNMFGVVPGAVYGWPKNALHWAGIHGSIVDINSSLPLPQFAIVDGIVGMEGNGPLQGQAKKSGVLVFGDDLVAVDATAARLMTIEPRKIKYLEMAGEFLGNIDYGKIEQIGEKVERFQQDFRVIENFKDLKTLTG